MDMMAKKTIDTKLGTIEAAAPVVVDDDWFWLFVVAKEEAALD